MHLIPQKHRGWWLALYIVVALFILTWLFSGIGSGSGGSGVIHGIISK